MAEEAGCQRQEEAGHDSAARFIVLAGRVREPPQGRKIEGDGLKDAGRPNEAAEGAGERRAQRADEDEDGREAHVLHDLVVHLQLIPVHACGVDEDNQHICAADGADSEERIGLSCGAADGAHTISA